MLHASQSLGSIPKGRVAPAPDPPPGGSARAKSLPGIGVFLKGAGPSRSVREEIVNRMVEAVTMQASAICEIKHHEPGPLGKAATIRPQGGWETIRIVVSVASDDCQAEAAALEAHVWPELRSWCAARRLHLLVLDAREGCTADSMLPTTCLLQIEASSRCNDGAPFALAGGVKAPDPLPAQLARRLRGFKLA